MICRESEALAYLSSVLTVFCLVMNFVIRKLGLTVSKLELAQLKETTLLKQARLAAYCIKFGHDC